MQKLWFVPFQGLSLRTSHSILQRLEKWELTGVKCRIYYVMNGFILSRTSSAVCYQGK
jgi:hypothetical protein